MQPVPLGEYELLVRVAVGGMGEVYLARKRSSVGFERQVAIKKLLPELTKDERVVNSMIDEARLVSRLTHQNIAQVYDLGCSEGCFFLVMEFLEGRDVRQIMKRLHDLSWPMPLAFAARIAADAAEGLHHAHELCDERGEPFGLLHRDVSPQNLFVTFDGRIKVLDFGIAKARSRLATTRDGVVKGRVSYVAPERVVGRPHDRRVDVFSLGVVLWEMITGRRLFRRRTDLESLEAIVAGLVPRPQAVNAECPDELERIVLRMLSTDPAARYPDCRLVQEDLEQFVASSGYVVTPQRLGQWVGQLFEGAPQTASQWLARERERVRG